MNSLLMKVWTVVALALLLTLLLVPLGLIVWDSLEHGAQL